MRRFEFVEGTSAKFWMADVQGNTFIVVYGRLGTDGQRKEKAFPDEEGARKEYTRKVAEKLREGYQEVGADASAAPAAAPAAKGTKGAAAPAKKLTLPPRVRGGKPTAEQAKGALEALTQLESLLGGRSWRVASQVRRARRALRALGGVDPAGHAELGAVFMSLMTKVTAPRGEPRLPLWGALELLAEVDVAAFTRTVEQWKRAPTGTTAQAAAGVLARQSGTLGEPELALRIGALLGARPQVRGGAEPTWDKRWQALRPFVEEHLAASGSSLAAWVGSLEAAGEPRLTERVSRLGA